MGSAVGAGVPHDRHAPVRIAVVAGETSSDALGAGLIDAIRSRVGSVEFFGVAGPRMREAGCEAWHRAEELSVMGLAEVLPHLVRLLRLRRRLIDRIIAARPDVFVGIDSSDFNLPLEAALRRHGIRTVQYVSPQVWAWRQSRVVDVEAATDLVLCLLPFERDFYAEHGVNARFVGHPMADAIPIEVDRAAARAALGLQRGTPILALLPGSRRAEVGRLARPFVETAEWLARSRPDLAFVVALAGPELEPVYAKATRSLGAGLAPLLITGRAREILAAADAVLTASGTASLEALLSKRPMVVAHRLSPATYWLARRLGAGRLPHFSLPNLLAGRGLVEEFAQSDVRADILGPAVLRCLDPASRSAGWLDEYNQIHRRLRRGADAAAAEAVLGLLNGELTGT